MSLRNLLVGFVLVASCSAMAGETLTNITNVLRSQASNRLLVLSGVDGRVYKVENSRGIRAQLEGLRGRNAVIRWTQQGNERIIVGVTPASSNLSDDLNFFVNNPNRSMEPTDLGDRAAVDRIFNSLNDTNKTRSQCFKRAHMWSFDMWSRLGVVSQKIFIFYTRRYIELQDFDWWFHVAPVVRAGGVDYALDRAFTNRPHTIEEWKNRFLNPNITCPVIDHYDQYESKQWNRLCYLRMMPMYYFRPADIRDLDRQGREKTGWVLSELQDARKAFTDGMETYEGLDTGARDITY